MQASATFEVTGWNEEPYGTDLEVPKLTRAHVTKTLRGDIEGTASVQYLMVYRENGTAHFVGHERITGALHGRSGSFVLQHVGTFEDGVASATRIVVPDSGTDELAGLRGKGGFASQHAEEYRMTLDYDLE